MMKIAKKMMSVQKMQIIKSENQIHMEIRIHLPGGKRTGDPRVRHASDKVYFKIVQSSRPHASMQSNFGSLSSSCQCSSRGPVSEPLMMRPRVMVMSLFELLIPCAIDV